MKNRGFAERLGFATAGLREGWRRERSFRAHVRFAVAAFVALPLLRPSAVWWAMVALTVVIVMALELVNSALEGVIDLLHPGLHPEIKAAKDMLAGAVLIASGAALVVGIALIVATEARWRGWLALLGA